MNDFAPGEEVIVARANKICHCGVAHGDFYINGAGVDKIKLQSEGLISRVQGDQIFVSIGGNEFFFSIEELVLKEDPLLAIVKAAIPGITKLPRNPIFEIAENSPVFLIDGKAYSLGEAGSEKCGSYKQGRKSKPVIEMGELASLDELLFSRSASKIEKLRDKYAETVSQDFKSLQQSMKESNVAVLIYKLVFPYLRENEYEKKVAEMIGAPVSPKQEQLLEKRDAEIDKAQIAKILAEVNKKVRQIESDGAKVQRTAKQVRLDELLGFNEERFDPNKSPLELVSRGGNVAIINGAVFQLVSNSPEMLDMICDVKILGDNYLVSERKRTLRSFEKSYIGELGRRIMRESLLSNFSREKVIEILASKNQELLGIRDKKEYNENGFGFLNVNGQYFVYIEVPEFAIEYAVDKK